MLGKPKSAGVVQRIAIQTVLCFALQHGNQEHLAEHRDPEFEAEIALLMIEVPKGLTALGQRSIPPSFQGFLTMYIAPPSNCLKRPPARLRSKYRCLRSSIIRPLAILLLVRCSNAPRESCLTRGALGLLVAVTRCSIVHYNVRYKTIASLSLSLNSTLDSMSPSYSKYRP